MKLAVLSDSPKKMTGFGNVIAQLCQGFHEAGIDVHVYGFMDSQEDFDNKLPYTFYPTPPMDELGHRTFGFFLRKVDPDVIFILTDPGNALMYTNDMLKGKVSNRKIGKNIYLPPVVLYTPIEGQPIHDDHIAAMEQIGMLGGALVLYCEAAKRAVENWAPHVLEYTHVVNHGLDHAPFRPYAPQERKVLRQLVGLDDKFVVGCGGVNKRTKGFPYLIYAARYLKDTNRHKDIIFYCHTNPRVGTMYGYDLKALARDWGVDDMFLWKQQIDPHSYWSGAERDKDIVAQAMELAGQVPDTPEGRGLLFTAYDFISIFNCFDLYVDPSQNEGWGLMTGEAMACGVPVIRVRDYHVRDEIYGDANYEIAPLSPHLWETWHTGSRLVTLDPHVLAEAILYMKNNPCERERYTKLGLERAGRYIWQDAKEQMTKIVFDVYERDQQAIAGLLEK